MSATTAVRPTGDATTATGTRVSLPILLLWLGISLIGVYLVFVAGGFPGIFQVRWRLLTHTLTLVVIVGWLVVSFTSWGSNTSNTKSLGRDT